MKLDEYQEAASRTMVWGQDSALATMVVALGLCGEAGEVAELIKKWVGHGHPLEKDKIKEELGDVLWYLAALATHMGFSLEVVARENIDKLKARYPDGFSEERSAQR